VLGFIFVIYTLWHILKYYFTLPTD